MYVILRGSVNFIVDTTSSLGFKERLFINHLNDG